MNSLLAFVLILDAAAGFSLNAPAPSSAVRSVRAVRGTPLAMAEQQTKFKLPWQKGDTESMSGKVEPTGAKGEGEGEDNASMMQKVKDAGIAGIISYIFWEWAFWGVSIPVCIGAYYEVTGHWPDFSNSEDLQKLGAEAFAFVNVARFAIPLRIGLALSTTPWVKSNIVDKFGLDKDKKD